MPKSSRQETSAHSTGERTARKEGALLGDPEPAVAGSGAGAGGAPGAPRGVADSLRGAGAMLGDVLRVPAGLAAVLGAALVGAVRRARS